MSGYYDLARLTCKANHYVIIIIVVVVIVHHVLF